MISSGASLGGCRAKRGAPAQPARVRIAELEAERVPLVAQANQKVVAYNAAIGEKQEYLETLDAMARPDRPSVNGSEQEMTREHRKQLTSTKSRQGEVSCRLSS